MAAGQTKEVGVYQLKNGKWAYRFIVRVNGEQKTQRRTCDENGKPFNTSKQAARARKKALEQVQKGLAAETPKAKGKEKPIVRKRIKEVYEEYCRTGRTDKAFATIKKPSKPWNPWASLSFWKYQKQLLPIGLSKKLNGKME